jgi:hypothetical protein
MLSRKLLLLDRREHLVTKAFLLPQTDALNIDQDEIQLIVFSDLYNIAIGTNL